MAEPQYQNISATPTVESLVDVTHISEGVLIKKEDGDIFHFYRFADGEAGDHTGNTGRISKRLFDFSEQTWGAPEVFYNSDYDDRNINGGKTTSGRIVLFIWRHDYTTPAVVDCIYLCSDDDGVNWSSPVAVTSSLTDPVPYGDMIEVPTKGYLKGFVDEATQYRVSVQFSTDGTAWGDEVIVGDYTAGHEYNISEPSFAYVGDGKIICICRDQNYTANGANYYQITSDDYGDTWGTPVKTNIGAPYFTPAPKLIIYGDKLVVLGSDRRTYDGTVPADRYSIAYEGLFVFVGDINAVFASPTVYKQKLYIRRPLTTSTLTFYGYPTFVKITDHKYFVVFTDRYQDATNEDANLYQFYLDLEGPVVGATYLLPVASNN